MKFFIFKPKLSLWDEFLKEIPKNDDNGEFPDFHELTLYMIFAVFLKMSIPMTAIFVKNFKNHRVNS